MSARLSVIDGQTSTLYNVALLHWRRRELGLHLIDISQFLSIRPQTITHVFQGRASARFVYRVACFLGLDWALVHDLDLPPSRYPLAVRNGIPEGRQLIATKDASSNSP